MWLFPLSYMLENNIFELKSHDFRSNSKWGHFFFTFFLEKDQAEDTPPLPPSKGPTIKDPQAR